ncbi:MAG: metal-dependent hydrolase [Actinomycetota bacterium]
MDTTLPVRRPSFDYADDADPMWTPARPEFACAANSVSLLMPYMEPYFIRSIASVTTSLPSDQAELARTYIGQERAHQREHRRYNRLLAGRYPSLAWLERRAAATYRWLGRTRSPAFNVAFTAASETIAYSAARWAAEYRRTLFDGVDGPLAHLFIWHLAEEVEHKSAAWDIHLALGRGRPRLRYLLAAAPALLLVALFVTAGTTLMLIAERRLHSPVAWMRLLRWGVTFTFELIPNLVMALGPDHHPDRFADPLWYDVWLRELDTSPAG